MLHFLPAPILGSLALVLMTMNTVWWCSLLILCSFLKLLIPLHPVQVGISVVLVWIAKAWVNGNNLIFGLTQKIDWDVQGPGDLNPRGWYFVLPNHRSWVDILVLQKIFNGKIPFLKFFLKKQLIWVPFLGPAWWALDFPFMRRHTREEIARKPELQGRDLETTRKACEKFKQIPVSVITFPEGTRFTPARHSRQKSPYRHLLAPKAGGISFTLKVMGTTFKHVLDVTIFYPQKKVTLWDFVCGRITGIKVRVREIPVPYELCEGSPLDEATLQEKSRAWINDIWREKDELLESLNAPACG